MRTMLLLTISVFLLLLSGCGGDADTGRPVDMPKICSVKITITQDGKPLEGAKVTLIAKEQTKYGTAGGTTNAAGVVAPKTYGFVGVPVGDYAVTIEKIDDESGVRYVDAQYASETTTPHSITVTEKGATATFEVGKPAQ